jgi:hypothetical protein
MPKTEDGAVVSKLTGPEPTAGFFSIDHAAFRCVAAQQGLNAAVAYLTSQAELGPTIKSPSGVRKPSINAQALAG